MNKELNVAVFGNVESDFRGLAKFIREIKRAYGRLDHCFVIGNLFKKGDNEKCIDKLFSGGYKFAIHTYFILGNRALPERISSKLKSNNVLAENFEFLGNSGRLTLESGLKIAYFSGVPQENINEAELQPHQYNISDIQKMIDTTECNSIDVLLTYDWPSGKGSLNQYHPNIAPPPHSNSHLNSLIRHIRPKYHYASRLSTHLVILDPYIIEINSTISSVTNFVNVPSSLHYHPHSWSYGFLINPDLPNQHLTESLQPSSSQESPPSNDTETNSTKRSIEILKEGQSQSNRHFFDCAEDKKKSKAPRKGYVCKICKNENHFIKDCPQKTQPKKTFYSTTDCLFCIYNEKCASHLIVSSGEELYLAMDRGSLIDPKAPSTKIPGGGQLLIMPITHASTVANFETQPESKGYRELELFKKAIKEFYTIFDCFPFYFETYRPSVNQHGLLQVYPIPEENKLALDKAIDEAFINENTQPESNFQSTLESPFIRLEYGNAIKGISYNFQAKIPLFLGRKVLGSVLNCKDRIDRRKCKEFTIEEETKFKNDFSKSFSKFNPFS